MGLETRVGQFFLNEVIANQIEFLFEKLASCKKQIEPAAIYVCDDQERSKEIDISFSVLYNIIVGFH